MVVIVLLAASLSAPANATAEIIVDYGNGAAFVGSGTVIASERGKSLVLTNRHVAPSAAGTKTVKVGGKGYAGKWLAAAKDADLALIEIEASLPRVILAFDTPARNEPVWYVGHSRAGGICRNGLCYGVNGRGDTTGIHFMVMTRADGGDSGAGVFDAKGRLFAVVWARDERFNSTLSVHGWNVRRFLRGVISGYPALEYSLSGPDVPPPP